MGLTIISHKEGGSDVRKMKTLLRGIKEDMHELCEMIEDADIHERGGYRSEGGYSERSRYREDDDLDMRRGRRY